MTADEWTGSFHTDLRLLSPVDAGLFCVPEHFNADIAPSLVAPKHLNRFLIQVFWRASCRCVALKCSTERRQNKKPADSSTDFPRNELLRCGFFIVFLAVRPVVAIVTVVTIGFFRNAVLHDADDVGINLVEHRFAGHDGTFLRDPIRND